MRAKKTDAFVLLKTLLIAFRFSIQVSQSVLNLYVIYESIRKVMKIGNLIRHLTHEGTNTKRYPTP